MSAPPAGGRAVARVDAGAIERNCRSLAGRLGGRAKLCAVVKADGYGHGARACAEAALRGGAEGLAVAAAEEAAELREVLPEVPILVMGALTGEELQAALAARTEVAVWSERFLELCAGLATDSGEPARVHVKHDSGMGRLGERDPDVVVELAAACAADPQLALAGIWTHLATADEDDDSYMRAQLEAFVPVVARVREIEPRVIAHAANSAATIREPASHLDMVRCGVAIYGLDPFQRDPAASGLEPALTLASYVADVKRFEPGDSAGYGRTWTAAEPTSVGVLPIGYADGVRRALSNNAEVLVRGRRRPLIGTVSMDNVTIDLGPETEVERGDEAVLIGAQGGERILAEELAARVGTINYEIATGIGPRVPRVAAT